MKFKDKNGNIFAPTSKFTEEQMKKSKLYTEVKEDKKEKKAKDLKKELAGFDSINEVTENK